MRVEDIPNLVAYGGNNTTGPIDVATACNAHGGSGRMDFESETFIAFDTTQITSRENRSNPQPGDPCHPLAATGHAPAVAYQCHGSNVGPMGTLRAGNGNETGGVPFVADTITANWHKSNGAKAGNGFGVLNPIINRKRVRRLTPLECERLQAFPDYWTRWGADGEEISDSARYRMIGNSVARTCVEWVMRRLVAAE